MKQNTLKERNDFMSFTKIQYIDNETIITADNLNGIQDELINLYEELNNLEKEVLDFTNLIFPVGSIYISTNSISPASFLGGTWEQIQETFLFAAGETTMAGTTGGYIVHNHTTQAHTLTVAEMPFHNHALPFYGQSATPGYLAYQLSGISENNTATGGAGGNQPHTHGDTGITSSMPPYLAVYMWKRVD